MRSAIPAFVMVALLACGSAFAQLDPLCGDADDDGARTISDGVNVLRTAAGLTSSCRRAVCDTNGDRVVSVTDGVDVLRSAAGLSATLTCLPQRVERVQQASVTTPAGATSLSATWPQPTERGSLLLLVAHVVWNSTVGAITVPSGWTAIERADHLGFRKVTVALYYREGAASESGRVDVRADGDPENRLKLVLAEYGGVRDGESLDRHAQAAGFGPTLSSGVSATTAQPREVWIGAVAGGGGQQCDPTNGFALVEIPSSGASTLGMYERFAAATGSASVDVRLGDFRCSSDEVFESDWAGVVATFRVASNVDD